MSGQSAPRCKGQLCGATFMVRETTRETRRGGPSGHAFSMPETIFRARAAVYGALGCSAWRSARGGAPAGGVDPIVLRPLRGDTVAAHLERVFAVGFVALYSASS